MTEQQDGLPDIDLSVSPRLERLCRHLVAHSGLDPDEMIRVHAAELFSPGRIREFSRTHTIRVPRWRVAAVQSSLMMAAFDFLMRETFPPGEILEFSNPVLLSSDGVVND